MSFNTEEISNLKSSGSKKILRRTCSDEEDVEISELTSEIQPKKNYINIIVDSNSSAYCFPKEKEVNRLKVLKYLLNKIKTKEFNPKGYKFSFNISLWNPEDSTSIDILNKNGKTEIRIIRSDINACKDKDFTEILRKIVSSTPKPDRASVTPSPKTVSSAPSPSPSPISRPQSGSFSPLVDVSDLWDAMENGDDEKFETLMKESKSNTPAPLENIQETDEETVQEPVQETVQEIVEEEVEEEVEEIVTFVPPKPEPVRETVVEARIYSCSGNMFNVRDVNGNEHQIEVSLIDSFLTNLSMVGISNHCEKLREEIKKLSDLNTKLEKKLRFSKSNVSKIEKSLTFCNDTNRATLTKKLGELSAKVSKGRSDLNEYLENTKRQLEESSVESEEILINELFRLKKELTQNQNNYDFYYATNDAKLRLLVPEYEVINEMKNKINVWFKFSSTVISALKTASSELNFTCYLKISTQGTKSNVSFVGIKPSDKLIQLTDTLYELKNPPISSPSPVLAGWGGKSPMQITQMVSLPGVPSPNAVVSKLKKVNPKKPSKIKTRNSDSDFDSDFEEYSSESEDEYDLKYSRKNRE